MAKEIRTIKGHYIGLIALVINRIDAVIYFAIIDKDICTTLYLLTV